MDEDLYSNSQINQKAKKMMFNQFSSNRVSDFDSHSKNESCKNKD